MKQLKPNIKATNCDSVNQFLHIPVSTRRCFDVDATLFGRRNNVVCLLELYTLRVGSNKFLMTETIVMKFVWRKDSRIYLFRFDAAILDYI